MAWRAIAKVNSAWRASCPRTPAISRAEVSATAVRALIQL